MNVASDIHKKGYEFLFLKVNEGKVEERDGSIIVKYAIEESINFLKDPENFMIIMDSYKKYTSKPLVFELGIKITKDSSLPVLKEMFGDLLKILK